MQYCELSEVLWPADDLEKALNIEWDARVKTIGAMTPPKGKDKVIIDEIEHKESGNLYKGIFYYGDEWGPDRGFWAILSKNRVTGLWIRLNGDYDTGDIENKNKMWEHGLKVARSYRAPAFRNDKAMVIQGRDSFYMEHGAIDLPFKYNESVDIWFKGHRLDGELEFGINTRVVFKEYKTGLLERTDAFLSANKGLNVKFERLRGRKRIVAGMLGEELIEIGEDESEKMLMCAWMHSGEANSSHRPRVLIEMNAKNIEIEKKIALWDTMLDSMRLGSGINQAKK